MNGSNSRCGADEGKAIATGDHSAQTALSSMLFYPPQHCISWLLYGLLSLVPSDQMSLLWTSHNMAIER